MKQSRLIITLGWIVLAAISAAAQPTLYPVPVSGGLGSMRLEKQAGQPVFIADKGYEYKLQLGFPREDQATFLRNTDADVVVLWLRVENLSKKPLVFTADKFTVTDKEGNSYARIEPAVAYERIVSASSLTSKILKKGISSASLGKVGGKGDRADDKDEASRFAFKAGTLPALGVSQGLIYFEAPKAKKFTINVKLGDWWTSPFIFTNVGPK